MSTALYFVPRLFVGTYLQVDMSYLTHLPEVPAVTVLIGAAETDAVAAALTTAITARTPM